MPRCFYRVYEANRPEGGLKGALENWERLGARWGYRVLIKQVARRALGRSLAFCIFAL